MALTDKLTAIANAIRAKTGGTSELTLDNMATEIANISVGTGSTDDNKTYIVKDTKREYANFKLWGYNNFRGNADFQAVSPYTNQYQTFTTDVMDLSNYSKAVIKFTAIEYYSDSSYPTDLNFILANTEYTNSLSTGNGYLKSDYVVKKVTKTIEDINNGFKGAYVTLELDLTDITNGALVFESCKCCTTILDFWIEKAVI